MSIKDKGIGLSEAEAGKVFKKYFRSAQAVKLNPVGTGVGLNVVKFFLEAHRGTVFVKSEPNKGSTFGFKLPLA